MTIRRSWNMTHPRLEAEVSLDLEDADLINNLYENKSSYIGWRHKFYHGHLMNDMHDYLIVPQLNPEQLDPDVENFIRLLSPDTFKNELLRETPTNVLKTCTDLLLLHNCKPFGNCEKYLEVIMKLRLDLNHLTTHISIKRDFVLLAKYGFDSNLLLLYFITFIENLNLSYYFVGAMPLDALEYCILTATDALRPHLLELGRIWPHHFVEFKEYDKLELIIKYGAINENLTDFSCCQRCDFRMDFDHPTRLLLSIENGIQMRAVQAFRMFRDRVKPRTIQMLMASNLEPFLTEDQYKSAFPQLRISSDIQDLIEI